MARLRRRNCIILQAAKELADQLTRPQPQMEVNQGTEFELSRRGSIFVQRPLPLRALTSVNDAFSDGIEDELGWAVNAQLFKNIAAVRLYGIQADVETRCHFFVRFSFR